MQESRLIADHVPGTRTGHEYPPRGTYTRAELEEARRRQAELMQRKLDVEVGLRNVERGQQIRRGARDAIAKQLAQETAAPARPFRRRLSKRERKAQRAGR